MRHAWMLGLFLGALLLRLFNIEQNNLNLDEIGVVLYAQSPLVDTIKQALAHVGSVPLDYVMTWLTWRALGHSDGILRLAPVLWGSLSVVILYAIGLRLFGHWPAAAAALPLALSPLHIELSRQVRMYSLGTFLILIVVWVFMLAIERKRWHGWVVFAMALAIALYAHYYTLFLLPAMLLWLVVFKRDQAVPFTLASITALILFAPWFYYDNIVLRANTTNTAPVHLWSEIRIHAPTITASIAAWPLWLLWLAAPVVAYTRRNQSLWLVWGISVVGLLCVLVIGIVSRYGIGGRHVVAFLPYFWLVLAGTLGLWITQRRMIALVAGAAIVAIVLFLPEVERLYYAPSHDYQAATQQLRWNIRPGEKIIADDPRWLWYYMSEYRGHAPWLHFSEWTPERLMQFGNRVWIVVVEKDRLPTWTPPAGWVFEPAYSVKGVEIYRFERTPELSMR
ncbi:MAG: glycosyltransferase family 39 protein [Caldilineaceae bacterium]|nr:glycosyltransferase family 39 protein [Caldilineaceae bacterium]